MSLPIIFCIDDDPQVLRAITRDLKAHFRAEYRILSTTSVKEALDSLLELKNKSEVIALFVSDPNQAACPLAPLWRHSGLAHLC